MKLDFSLSTTEERIAYVEKILNDYSPTENELQKMADYILYGKDKDTGKNGVQEGYYKIDTHYSHWNKEPVESLDALMENPLFTEIQLYQPTAPLKVTREVFSREEAMDEAPPQILKKLKTLWETIDFLELTTNFYDLKTGKRKKPPRASLLARFTPEEIAKAQTNAENLSQKEYLKIRHIIIDMRQEQYSLRDAYRTQIFSQPTPITVFEDPLEQFYEDELQCLPENTVDNNPLAFKALHLTPNDFTDDELRSLIDTHWNIRRNNENKINFADEEHVTILLRMSDELVATPSLYKTLQFYVKNSLLTDSQKDILKLKIKKIPNQKIREIINNKYGTQYTENYISTIYHKIIIPRICEAADLHGQIIENITFPEEFKTCNTCGKTLFKSTYNFVRRQRASDGFAYRCKRCDKEARKL